MNQVRSASRLNKTKKNIPHIPKPRNMFEDTTDENILSLRIQVPRSPFGSASSSSNTPFASLQSPVLSEGFYFPLHTPLSVVSVSSPSPQVLSFDEVVRSPGTQSNQFLSQQTVLSDPSHAFLSVRSSVNPLTPLGTLSSTASVIDKRLLTGSSTKRVSFLNHFSEVSLHQIGLMKSKEIQEILVASDTWEKKTGHILMNHAANSNGIQNSQFDEFLFWFFEKFFSIDRTKCMNLIELYRKSNSSLMQNVLTELDLKLCIKSSLGILIEKFVCLNDIDLSNMDLRDFDFGKGMELKNGNFRNSNLSGLDLSECQFIGCDFSCADLSLINFSRSNLSHSNFKKSNLNNSNFSNSNLSYTNFRKTSLINSDFNSSNLAFSDFTKAKLNCSVLSKCNLSNAIMVRSILTKSKLDYAILNNTKMSYVDLSGADMRGVMLARIFPTGPDLRFSKCFGVNMIWANLISADFKGSDLRNSNCQSANFRYANFEEADFREADLRCADFYCANVKFAIFDDQIQSDFFSS